MIDEFKKGFTLFRLLVVLLTISVSLYLLQIAWQFLGNFSDIIITVVMAWLLSFILEPLVNFVSGISKLPKIFSALIVYIFFAIVITAMVFLFIPVVTNQFQSLSTLIPQYLASYPKFIQTWNNAVTHSFDTLIILIPSLANIFIDIILILFLSFYFIVDKDRINQEIYNLAPQNWHKNLKFIQNVIDSTFSSFLRIQVIFGLLAGVLTWIILTILGVEYAASVSLIAGLLTIIPLAGPFLALIPPVLIVLITDPNNLTKAALVFVILLLVQQLIFNAIGPKLMGKAFKLHPIIVILSIVIGYKIAGPLGAVFVVPVLGIVMIVIKQLGHYFINPQKEE